VLIGECPSIKNILSMVGRLGSVDATILITGETGTGKEVVAKMIHHNSTRRDKPFVVVNCGAIPENLIESELFGHERGSFTGAYTTQKGKFELAHGGSILLDEIGELPLHLQPKILRAVEERQVQRIGGKSPIPLNVRILAATNKDLEATVREGRFRQDLFYRLNVISIHIPALRNRDRDALILAHYFVRQYAAGYAKPVKQFTPDAESLILKYHWPGNVRELAHLIERAVIMDQDGTICPKDLDLKPIFTRPQRLKDITGEAEKDAVLNALVRNRGNISRASRELDISRVTFKNMIRKYGFKPHDYRGG
jgi:transcriptional regulator with PAS, ATPase and Fis domain